MNKKLFDINRVHNINSMYAIIIHQSVTAVKLLYYIYFDE